MKKRAFGVLCALCITVTSFSQEAVAVEPQNQMAENLSSDLKPLPPVIVGPQEQPTESQPSNTTMEKAVELENTKLYDDVFTSEKRKRYYKLSVKNVSFFVFGIHSEKGAKVRLLNEKGRKLSAWKVGANNRFTYWSDLNGAESIIFSDDGHPNGEVETLETGTYYLEISVDSNEFSNGITSVRFHAMGKILPLDPEVKLSKTSAVYTGKKIKRPSVQLKWEIKPSCDPKYLDPYNKVYDMRTGKRVKSVKEIGRYIITTKYFEPNYYGDGWGIFTVTPQKGVIKNVKSKKKGQVQVTAKNNTAAGRYQIQISTDRSFEKDVKEINTRNTRQAVKKLKSKQTYYVRLRYYKNVSKKYIHGQSEPEPIYGAWSKTKTVICK